MQMQAQGTVVDVRNYEKNFQVKLDNGQMYGAFKTTNKTIPQQGQVVLITYTQNGKYNNVTNNGIQVVGGAPAQQPAYQMPQQNQYQQPPQQQYTAPPQPPAGRQQPPRVDERQLSIHYQSSRNAAIAFLELAVSAGDVIALPTKKADRLDALLALTEEVTNKFFLQLEDVIASGGLAADVPLPQAEDVQ